MCVDSLILDEPVEKGDLKELKNLRVHFLTLPVLTIIHNMVNK